MKRESALEEESAWSGSEPVAVYYSHHKKDLRAVQELDTHLDVSRRLHVLSTWHTGTIPGGMPVEQERSRHWEQARLILLFVSPDYLADPRCHEEMLLAIARTCKDSVLMIPLLLRPSIWQSTPLADFQPLPIDGNFISLHRHKDKAFADIAEHIRKLVDGIRLQQDRANRSQPADMYELPSLEYYALNGVLPLQQHSSLLQRHTLVRTIYTLLTGGTISTLVLTGLAGSGKSTLATLLCGYAEAQRQSGDNSFTGRPLWLALKPGVSLVTLTRTLASALGETATDLEALFPEELALKLFHRLNHKDNRRLIVLDGFAAGQTDLMGSANLAIREFIDLLNSSVCTCRILITARLMLRGERISRANCVQEFALPGLTEQEGITLLRRWDIQATDKSLGHAVKLCQGHPTALVLLDKLLHSRHLSLSTLLNSSIYKRLWANNVTQNLFNDIYQQLQELPHKLLLAYAIYREPVPWLAVYGIVRGQMQITEEQLQEPLNILLTLSLLQADSQEREEYYVLHPLVAEFARERLLSTQQPESLDRLQAHEEAAHFYQRRYAALSSAMQTAPETVHLLSEAVWHYCQAERWQVGHELLQHEQLFPRLRHQGAYNVLLELYTLFLPSENWATSLADQASMYNELGEIYNGLGAKAQAQSSFERSLELCRSTEEQMALRVKALNNLGSIYRIQGRIEQALTCYQEALHIAEGTTEPVEKGITLNNLGRALQDGGGAEPTEKKRKQHYRKALSYYKQALTLHRQDENMLEEARTRNNIGEVQEKLGLLEAAHKAYMQALSDLRQIGERRDVGIVCNNLGAFYRSTEQYADALEYYVLALRIFQQIGARWDEGIVLRNLGTLFLYMQHPEAALASFVLARDIYKELHQPERGTLSRSLQVLLASEQPFEQVLAEITPRATQVLEEALEEEKR